MAKRGAYIAQYLPKLQAEGLSGRAALATLREQGFAIRDSTFFRLWGETRDQIGRKGAFADAPLNRVITPDQMGTATRPRARGFLYHVQIAVEDQHSGEIGYHAWSVRSNRPLAHGTILRRATEGWQLAQSEGGAAYMGRSVGALLDDALQLVGEDEDTFTAP